MARLSYHKLFYDKEKLYILLNLRINGYSCTSLAIIFNCDVSSIRHQCDKYMISPEGEVYSFERIANNVIKSLQPQQPSEKDIKWEIADGTRYAVGKSYQEYLKAHYPPRKSH